MTTEKGIAKFFRLDDEGWMKHANPKSVYSRNTVLPALILAFWSRVWIGWWSLIPIALAILWTFFNPRLFKTAKSTKNWASKGVLGERIWMDRKKFQIPKHHKVLPHVLNIFNLIGFAMVIWALVILDVWLVLLGSAFLYFAKLWYVDRMVWLFEDMKHLPEFEKWLY
jgi:hypothetical protein